MVGTRTNSLSSLKSEKSRDSISELSYKAHKKEFWTCQDTMALMTFFGLCIAYCLRVNLSIAIVAMVGKNETGFDNSSTSSEPTCPYPEDGSGQEEYSEGDVDWSEKEQGLVLGSFYWGYICTNILGGLASQRFGSRLVFGTSILLASVLTLISPLAVRESSGLFIAVRTLEGFILGVTFPSMYNLLSAWVLPEERSKFSGLVIAGVDVGTVIAFALSGVLCNSDFLGGWPAAFYVYGAAGVVWAVFWFMLVYDTPEKHPRISARELSRLKSISKVKIDGFKMLPWKDVLTSVPFWSILITQFGYNWVFYTFLTELPSYLYQIQHFDLSSNGFLSALPYCITWIVSVSYTQLMTQLTKAGKISLLNVRRLAMVISGYGPVLGLIAMCFVGCNETMAIVLLCLSVGAGGASYAGFVCSNIDITPRYAGTIYGITNTIGTIPGFVSPIITGIITEDNQTLQAWRTVFLISASLFTVCITFYLFTIQVDVQYWNFYGTDLYHTEKSRHRNKSESKERF